MEKLTASKLLTITASSFGNRKTISLSETIKNTVNGEVTFNDNLDPTAISVSKELLTASEVNNINIIIAKMRKELESVAIPWPGVAKVYIVPEKLTERVLNCVKKYQEQWQNAVDNLIEAYPELIERAKQRLGALFCETDYLPPSEFAKKFKFNYVFTQIVLPEKQQEELKNQLIAQWNSIQEMTLNVLRTAFADLFTRFRKACNIVDGQRKPALHQNTWKKLMDFLETFPHRNLGDDVVLSKIVEDLHKVLRDIDFEALHDTEFRSWVYSETEAIAKAVEKLTAGVRNVVLDEEENNMSNEKETSLVQPEEVPVDQAEPTSESADLDEGTQEEYEEYDFDDESDEEFEEEFDEEFDEAFDEVFEEDN